VIGRLWGLGVCDGPHPSVYTGAPNSQTAFFLCVPRLTTLPLPNYPRLAHRACCIPTTPWAPSPCTAALSGARWEGGKGVVFMTVKVEVLYPWYVLMLWAGRRRGAWRGGTPRLCVPITSGELRL
jgi:hypothetical protein